MALSNELLARICNAVVHARTFEDLVRPLLEALEFATELETAYLTRIDEEAGIQRVLFSHNTNMMIIPEGLIVPWQDTLCKRALDDGQFYTNDISSCWGDSEAARELGIVTYVSTPIQLEDGSLYGTLCAASTKPQPLTGKGEQFLSFFAALITQQLYREKLIDQLQITNERLESLSNTDMLTGLPNRRSTFTEMSRMFAIAERAGQSILIAYIDLDNFKKINDDYGHEIGDAFLIEVSNRLGNCMRKGDFLGRLGGDEFVVIGLGPTIGEDSDLVVKLMQDRLQSPSQGRFEFENCSFDYSGASCGVVSVDPASVAPEDALHMADAVMYAQKRSRKTCNAGPLSLGDLSQANN